MIFLETVLSAEKKKRLHLVTLEGFGKVGKALFTVFFFLNVNKIAARFVSIWHIFAVGLHSLAVYCISLLSPQPLFPGLFSLPASAGADTAHLDCWISTFCPLRLCESHPSLQTSWLMLQHSVKPAMSAHTTYPRAEPQLSPLLSQVAAAFCPSSILLDCSFTFPPVTSWPIQLASPSRRGQRALSLQSICSCRLLKQPWSPHIMGISCGLSAPFALALPAWQN